jgi:hypothetical protein
VVRQSSRWPGGEPGRGSRFVLTEIRFVVTAEPF